MTLEVEITQQKGNKVLAKYSGTHDGVTIDQKVMVTLPTLVNFRLIKEAIQLVVREDFKHRYLIGMRFPMEVDIDGISKELQ